jgi:hypothetical protein
MPEPQTYGINPSDVDGALTGRTESGKLFRARVRSRVRRIDATWVVTQPNYKLIADAISPESFSVVFYDPKFNTYQTGTFYAPPDKGTMVARKSTSTQTGDYWELTVALIEV